ncbi:L-lactate permease [Helicobacter ailurogastricus]|uniref:L-lactate permease n=1 Tax=Helicobacter ailurogastricus TaxID=1578720 RepID=UPI000CF15788|nr:L-lactate permease [Helicobacter ailurogastricus]GLH58517.1 L-lactate permease LctP2 [Helicobacter ailurogastricus]GLH60017.1 L-lactate permease LctP2 [Helicobacter ailurogastricus]GMB90563.1 L-lactate permease LctP2 [Helicobacter ailurogastricus]
MWHQIYAPLGGSVGLSALVAALPIVLFFASLIVFKLKGHTAAFLSVALSVVIALVVYKMPAVMVASSFIYGFLYGLWPISWIIIAAIFLYKLSVKSGYFEILKESVQAITPDHRILVILIGFCFGSFLEGAIGFGGPVAITAAILVGLGLNPLYAAGLCLIANTAPVAFGAVGIPITAMAGAVGVSALSISAMAGKILFFISLLVPFFIVFLMDGVRGIKETFPAVFVAAFSFALAQYLSSNYLGPELPGILSAVVSLIATALFLRFWQPKHIFRSDGKEVTHDRQQHHICKVLVAWAPFIILIATIVIWTQPWFKALFAKGGALAFSNFYFEFSSISQKILKSAPFVFEGKSAASPVVFKLPLINTVGTSILVAALISIFVLRVKASEAIEVFGDTLKEMRYPILTIGLVLSFAFVSNYSGISATMALALTHTGKAFTFFSPIIGWVGVFLTGSDTSSNLLFGSLQQLTADNLKIPEILTLTANTVGGTLGKMISPQSIAIACAAVGLAGKESDLFKFTVKYSIAFVIVIGIVVSVIAYGFPQIVPSTNP